MIFEYDELKEYVTEDFEAFYEMGFNEKQIFSAILNEYEHGEGFNQVENVCIHLFIVLNYKERGLDYDMIVKRIKLILSEEVYNEIKSELKKEYTKFSTDLYVLGQEA